MKVSLQWLQNYIDAPLPDAQAVADALTFHAFEIESVENDILDVKVTADRGHDCLSHRGIAKELAAILKLPLKQQYDPFARKPDLSKKTDAVTVSIDLPAQAGDPVLCKRYIAGYIKGVKVGPSPDWLRGSLEALGQRSINNVVDATNLVMWNIGQPMHAFDAKKLGSLHLGVRRAKEGEQLETLDEKTYTLAPSMLVITAGDMPVGIAGVKGGRATGIDENTTDIIVEAANFDGPTVRKAAAALRLRTDASAHFEQVLSPELAAYGMQQMVELVAALAGGTVEGFVDAYPQPQEKREVSVSLSKINAVLGTSLSETDVSDVFTRLLFAFENKGGEFVVQIPFERLDLTIAENLVEEIGRIIGYDKVPSVELSPASNPAAVNQNFAASEWVRAALTKEGYSEVFTSVFADKGERAVLNKVDSIKPFLRSTLVDGLNEALKKNVQNKALLGLAEVRLFEVGTVWKDGKETLMAGIVTEKETAKEDPLSVFVKERTAYDDLPLSRTERYQSFSKYPFIARDIALWVPKGTKPVEVLEVIRHHAGSLLVRSEKFDEFAKGERVSYAFRLIFQSFDRTLVDEDANARMESVYAAVKEKGWEVR